MVDELHKAYESFASQLEEELREQERREKRILSLRKTMNGISELIQQQEGSGEWRERANATLHRMLDTSLTGDIEKIITFSSKPLTTTEIKDEMLKLGSLLEQHSNPLATINAIVSRLAESGRVKETAKDGRKAWERIPPQPWPSAGQRVLRGMRAAKEKAAKEKNDF